MPVTPLIHITAAWSNAVLTAMLPHFSECAKQLNLPIKTPITISQVVHFAPPIHTNYFQAAIWLTNGYWFDYGNGNIDGFRSPDDWFTQQDFENVERLVGKENMTTNEAIDFARHSFVKLGHKIADFHLDRPPTRFEGPCDTIKGHMPFCRSVWEIPTDETNVDESYSVEFDVNMEQKQIVGMYLISRKFWGPVPKIDVIPEMEPDRHKKETSGSEGTTVRPPLPQ